MVKRRRRTGRTQQYENPTYLDLIARVAHHARVTREALDLSQEEAADRCGMDTRVYQRVEAAEGNVTFTTLARLCNGLRIDGARLLRPVRRSRKRP